MTIMKRLFACGVAQQGSLPTAAGRGMATDLTATDVDLRKDLQDFPEEPVKHDMHSTTYSP